MGLVQLDFPHRRAGHCGSGALRDLLEFHGLTYDGEPPSESLAFGLGAGLGFFYFELPALQPPLYLVGRTAGLERDFCSHAGVQLDLRHTDDAGEGWRWLRDELDAGRPTMVNADIKELPYLRVRMHNTMHDIVVTGYDPDAGLAFVADNDRDEIQSCPLDALARARNSHAFPTPNRHATWVMEFPDELPAVEQSVRSAVTGAVTNMRHGGLALDGGAQQPGLAGVDAFAAAYPEWPARFGDRLSEAMRGLRVFTVKAGTGGAMFRSLHAGFLHDAAELLSDEQLARAAEVYDELAAEWVSLAHACEHDDAPAAHRAGLPHARAVGQLEHEGAAAMEKWLAG